MAHKHNAVVMDPAENRTNLDKPWCTLRAIRKWERRFRRYIVLPEEVWQHGASAARSTLMSLTVLLASIGVLAVSLFIYKRLRRTQQSIS